MPSRFFLIDPLDGTKEFIAGRDEFTVNVALVEDQYPVVGVIGAPALGRLMFGVSGTGAFERVKNGSVSPICRQSRHESEPLQVLVSRSHIDPLSERALARLPGHSLRPLGSSLKFLLIATGEADLYIRLAPTMGWDTAAGQAIVEAAGGVVLAENGVRLNYSLRDGLRNRGFVAAGSLDHARLVVGTASVSVPE
jgi:3'(2'), 5'-bisphosphate nucleotidase